MAKIPLRAYINEIETIIEQHQIEETIAHCHHILQVYPKHIDTYRMLGKAYLESRRYSNAIDIFERVLSAIPYDFVSHVGMSITREDEGNLDAAIWHMERAFEGQPYNAAIQGELRRLYGRRDGMEPPKIYLTRGALARMYAKGNLFQQAIAEFRAVIAEDPQRLDLQVFLAQMYLQSGETAKTIDTCGSIVKKLPYCLDANLILAKLLKESNRIEEAQTFDSRVQELDPYHAHVTTEMPDKDHVKDQAVLVEQLIWDGGPSIAATDQPEWVAPVGLTMEESRTIKDELPDWMDNLEDESSNPPLQEELLDGDDELIPDFMKDAGWGPSTGAFDESQSVFDDSDDDHISQDETEAVEGNIPDWLQHMAPPENGGTSEETSEFRDDISSIDENVNDSILGDETGDNISEWLMEPGSTLDLDSGEGISELPEWLREAVEEKELEEAGDVESITETETASITDTELPDWLQDVVEHEDLESIDDDSVLSLEPEALDWLQEEDFEQEDLAVGEEEITAASAVLEKDSSEVEFDTSEVRQGEPESEIQTSNEQDKPDWIEEVVQAQADTEPAPEEVEEDEDEGSIDVLKSAGIAGAAIAGVAAITSLDDEPQGDDAGEGDTKITEEGPLDEKDELEFDDADAAMAWLEGLAAKQGVSEDELLTSPEERIDEAPEWILESVVDEEVPHPSLEDETERIEAIPEIFEEPDEPTSSPESVDDSLEKSVFEELDQEEFLPRGEEPPEWLSELSKDLPSIDGELSETEEFEREEIDHSPEFVQGFVDDEAIISDDLEKETSASVDESKFDAEDADITLTWLEDLDTQDAEEDAQEVVLDSAEHVPDTVMAEDVLPEVPEFEASQITVETEDESDLTQDIAEDQDETEFDNADAAMAWLESLADEQKDSEDEIKASAPEYSDTTPEWVQIPVDSTISEEKPDLDEDEIGPHEEAITGIGEPADIPVEISEDLQDRERSSAEIDPGSVDEISSEFEDVDAAMAWLESLAAKQGVSEEELLTSPDERSETPPDWIEDIEKPEIDDLSSWLEESPLDSAESEIIIDESDELIVDSEPFVGDEAEPDADLDDIDAAMAWLENLASKQGVSEDELLTSPEERLDTPPDWVQTTDETTEPGRLTEQTIEDTVISGNQVEDVAISPPSWITDGQVPEDEEMAWLPTDVSETEDQLLDLNQASLIQLERLPGIGFIRAQRITSYREEHGDFTNINDLLDVPGIDHDTLDLLKTRVTLQNLEPEQGSKLASTQDDEDIFVPGDSEPDDVIHELQLAAQTKFNEDKIDEAILDYREMIKNGQRINAVINDLEKATQKFPEEVSILQTLGDAYMQADKLQDALEAYKKAENLLQ